MNETNYMKAVVQENEGASLEIKEIPIPVPGPGEVLVKMDYSPINPSDLSLIQGTYAIKTGYPLVPGIEGSGRVIDAGKGLIGKIRIGKRVACTSAQNRGGTWAEYMVTSAYRVIPLNRNIEDKQGSMLLVNPLTAAAFIEIAKNKGHRTIVNNAAASTLGKMLIYLCKKNDLELINIVRREDQIKTLRGLKAEYILSSDSPDFEKELGFIANKMNARLFFDAVGGNQTGIMLKVSPPGTTIIPYAKLSETNISIDPRLLIQQNKKLEGFYLGHYTSGKSVLENIKTINKMKSLMSNGLAINISSVYPLENINKALEQYRNNMSSGKVLIQI